MAKEIQYACVSHIGKLRGNHEDNFWCDGKYLEEKNQGTKELITGSVSWKERPAFGVFDGMGGESCGETAAYLCARAFGESWEKEKTAVLWRPEKAIERVCDSMNQAVLAYEEEHRTGTMGSTAVMAFFTGRGLYAANLGDSRAYFCTRSDFYQVSVDHVAMEKRYRKPPLVQFLGIPPEEMVLEPSTARITDLGEGFLLLCSDGVTDMLSDREIREILLEETEAGNGAEMLLRKSLLKGGRDNITILLLKIPRRGFGS